MCPCAAGGLVKIRIKNLDLTGGLGQSHPLAMLTKWKNEIVHTMAAIWFLKSMNKLPSLNAGVILVNNVEHQYTLFINIKY